MAHCPTCDTELSDPLAACSRCEPDDGPVTHCPRCGEDYQGDGCPACGALREPGGCDRHPDRSARGRCVVCGRALCEQCHEGDGRAFLCDEHRTVTVIEGWAQVYSATSEFEAQLLRDNLRAEGIDAQIYSQRDTVFSVDLGELSIVRLLVPVWDYDRALRTIREHMDSEGEVAFACPVCGEAYEPGTSECTGCGETLA